MNTGGVWTRSFGQVWNNWQPRSAWEEDPRRSPGCQGEAHLGGLHRRTGCVSGVGR